MIIIVLSSCRENKQERESLQLIDCNDDLCKSVLYDIYIAKFNLDLTVQEGISREEEIIKYCLTTDSQCGSRIYYSIRKLINKDSIRFKVLNEKYFIGNKESFLDNTIKPSLTATLESISNIENDIYKICNCN